MNTFSIDKALEILAQTPSTLESFLQNLSDEWIFANEGENTWSSYDVIGHLIHGEKTDWIPRTDQILKDSHKEFTPFDRFAQFENSKGKSIQELLQEFKDLRAKNIAYLTSLHLSKEDLQQIGYHPEFGEVTLQQLLATWTVHDLEHISQIARVLAKQYKEEAGPWVAYLSILQQ